jgi:hypothetical protein
VAITVSHADGTSETNSFLAGDWYNGTNQAFTVNGRINVATRAFDTVGGGNPRLYSLDVNLSNSSSPVTSIAFQLASGGGHAGIFAVSGSSGAGFTPIAVSGYTDDMIIEATAEAPPAGLNVTTASMDNGTGNTGYTWYEAGYNPSAPTTGLPAAGSTLTNTSASDHVYALPANYTNNNAVLVDNGGGGNIAFTTPTAFSALSFLTSSGGGAVTISYTLSQQDGTAQSGTFVSPDWFNNTPVAFSPNGRASVDNGGLDSVNSGNPRLYSVDIAVTNTTSPIVSVSLSLFEGTGHSAIFAVSGATGSVAPIFDVQPVSTNAYVGSTISLSASVSGSQPISYQWLSGTNGTLVSNGGSISGATSSTLTFTGIALTNGGGYRLVASNASGSSTSLVAQVNVISTNLDITSASDTITNVGGSSPDAEVVMFAVDDTTQKYLNFGADGDTAAPFLGPVGLIVTPAVGSTVVSGLRVYTANDAVERDPVDYKLEGSNDGTTFTLISQGPLALPDGRNASGQPIDPIALINQEVLFSNTAGYTSYRLTFANVKNNATANSVQIGEIELLGTTGTGTVTPQLTISKGGDGSITLTSSAPGTLESTTALSDNATWQSEGPINGSTTVTPTGTMKFYRVRGQ